MIHGKRHKAPGIVDFLRLVQPQGEQLAARVEALDQPTCGAPEFISALYIQATRRAGQVPHAPTKRKRAGMVTGLETAARGPERAAW